MRNEKRNRIIQALTDKSLTWKELLQETKLPEATLHRYLKLLISHGIVHKIPTVYSLSHRMEIVIPQEPTTIMLVKDVKRVKSGKMSGKTTEEMKIVKPKKVRLIPLAAVKKEKKA